MPPAAAAGRWTARSIRYAPIAGSAAVSPDICNDAETGRDFIAFVDGAGGPANENRLCVKGRFGFDYVTNPERLTRPLIRKPGLPKGLNMNLADPLTHFREVSWEEALDFAAQGLKTIRERDGGKVLRFLLGQMLQ